MKKYYLIILLIVFAAVIAILGLRFLSGEDDWICNQGEWVKHGNPSIEKPLTSCEK
jgi:hypothetical protein